LERFDGPIHIVEKGAFGSNVLSGMVADACGGVTRERHDAALISMESCHIDIVR